MDKYKNRGNELSNSFKTGNLQFFEMKTNSKRTQIERKKHVPTSQFGALCDELAPDFPNVGHQPLDHFVPAGLVLRTELPAVALQPFRPRVFENHPQPRKFRRDDLPWARFANLNGEPFG